MQFFVVMAAFVVAVVGAVIGAILWTVRFPEQASVTITGDELEVRPMGAMAFWALSKGVRVPLSSVTSVQVAASRDLPHGIRAPGAYLRGVICAGTYRRKGEKALWFVGRAGLVLDITLEGQDYQRVVAEVPHPAVAQATIQRALDARPAPLAPSPDTTPLEPPTLEG